MASLALLTTVTFAAPPPNSLKPTQGHCLRSNVSLLARGTGGRKADLTVVGAMSSSSSSSAAKFKGTRMKEKQLTELIERKVMEAKEACAGDERSDECKVAWDEVEEVSQAKADLRLKLEKHDPLESFCKDNPETDECRIYED